MMTAKEYLSRAFLIDQRINSKLEQVQSLRALAEKATATLSSTYQKGTRNVSRMEDVITKIIDLENDISANINGLLEVKREIAATIACVDTQTHQTLLELRYLCFKTWDDISAELGYERRYVLKVHDKALQKLDTKRQAMTLENQRFV